jgi:hypothetical protein
MRTMMLALAATLLAVGSGFAEDKKDAIVRSIDAKGPNAPGRGDPSKPAKVTSAEELEKAVGKDQAEAIGKAVDFKKEYVLVFSWSGSGGDKLTAVGEKGDKPSAVFTLKRGLTRDLRPHFYVYAVAKDAEWKMAK